MNIRYLLLGSAAALAAVCGLSPAAFAKPVVPSVDAVTYCTPPLDNARVANTIAMAETVAMQALDIDAHFIDAHAAGPKDIAFPDKLYTLSVQADVVRPYTENVAIVADARNVYAPDLPVADIRSPVLPDQLLMVPHGWSPSISGASAQKVDGSPHLVADMGQLNLGSPAAATS